MRCARTVRPSTPKPHGPAAAKAIDASTIARRASRAATPAIDASHRSRRPRAEPSKTSVSTAVPTVCAVMTIAPCVSQSDRKTPVASSMVSALTSVPMGRPVTPNATAARHHRPRRRVRWTGWASASTTARKTSSATQPAKGVNPPRGAGQTRSANASTIASWANNATASAMDANPFQAGPVGASTVKHCASTTAPRGWSATPNAAAACRRLRAAAPIV